jgi:two-component system, LytTR family, response regulator LytT
MRYFILEDEQLAAERVQQFIRRYDPDAVIAGWEKSIQQGLQWLQNHPAPDLIFSDIELLDGNVFHLFAQITPACPVIFATAYDQYLLHAFQTNGIAYLLKPYDYGQFEAAMQKFERLSGPRRWSAELLRALQLALQPAGGRTYKQRFTVRKNSGIYLIDTKDIVFFQAEEKIVFACTADQKRHPLSLSLQETADQLDPQRFFRLNRSELIHIAFVEKLENYGKDRLAVQLRGWPQALVSSAARTADLRDWIRF